MDGGADNAIHFCVLIHGLWGNPNHLQILSTALQAAHPKDKLHILLAKRNSGNYTYDGVEKGGERITREIEDELEALDKSGKNVTRFSLVGYSLGGLVARYTAGLLFSKGYFDKMEPVNFATFATPHLGTRAPLIGWSSDAYNALGARTLSASGRQLWAIDDFRETGRPLLSILADPEGIFMKALSAFKHRVLYANIVNDRAVPFYTAFISKIDPFDDLTAIDIHYEPGYDDVILSEKFATPKEKRLTPYENLVGQSRIHLYKMPYYLAFGLLGPIAALVFLGNAGVQAIQSAQRIKSHEEGTAGIDTKSYHLPGLADRIQRKADQAFQELNHAQKEEHIEDTTNVTDPSTKSDSLEPEQDPMSSTSSIAQTPEQPQGHDTIPDESNKTGFKTLALTKEQFEMKDSLDAVGFQKYAVHIHNANHSHAAIIIRMQRLGFGEGRVVSRHWIERFEI